MEKDKYIKEPKTSAEYAHNREVANLKYNAVHLKSKGKENDLKKAINILNMDMLDLRPYMKNPSLYKKERTWAEEIVKTKKRLDKEKKFWASEVNKWKKLEKQASSKEKILKTGNKKSR